MNTETVSSSTAPTTAPAARWVIDASHSHVAFSVRHLMISNVRGEFQKLSGEATFDPDRPEAGRIAVTIDVASINTREEKRDAHLRSADFFDAEKYPTIEFVSTEVRRRGGDLEVTGNLTIAGTTRPVTLAVEELTDEHSDPWGNRRVGINAHTKIRRSDFGMKWNAALETGGVLVGDEIKINVEAELIRQK